MRELCCGQTGRGIRSDWRNFLARFTSCTKLGDNLSRLSVAHNVTEPILKTIVANPKMVIAALNALEHQPAVITTVADSNIIDKDARLRRPCVNSKGRNRQ